MHSLYNKLGRLLYPGRQDWEQRKNTKTFLFTVAFALALGLAIAKAICLMYYHKK